MVLSILAVVAMLCGIFLVLWGIGEALRLSAPKEACHIIPLKTGKADVEQVIKGALQALRGRIFFVDCGLDQEEQICAQILLRQSEAASLCTQEQLMDYLRLENGFGTGAD